MSMIREIKVVDNPGPFRQPSVVAMIHDLIADIPPGSSVVIGPILGKYRKSDRGPRLQTLVAYVAKRTGRKMTTATEDKTGKVRVWNSSITPAPSGN